MESHSAVSVGAAVRLAADVHDEKSDQAEVGHDRPPGPQPFADAQEDHSDWAVGRPLALAQLLHSAVFVGQPLTPAELAHCPHAPGPHAPPGGDVYVLHLPLVTEYVAYGVAVMVAPAFAHSCAMASLTSLFWESLQDELSTQVFRVLSLSLSLQRLLESE